MSNEDRQWPIQFLLLGMLFGVATGLAEFAVRFFIAVVLSRPADHDFGLDLIWVLPVANLIVFGAVGLVIGVISMRWRGARLAHVAFAGFTAAGAFAILLHFRSLHVLVSIILSIGVGVRAADLVGKRADGLNRFVRRRTWAALVAVALMVLVIRATEAVREHRAVAGLAPAAAHAPNVLIIVLDAVRAPDISLYGYARRTTPQLDRFAERSVRFERAIVTAPWTLPSHASMFTGRFPHEMSADWETPLDATHPTLAEVLRHRGYVTAGFIANHFYGAPVFGLNRGFLHYESRKFTLASMIATSKLGDALVRVLNRMTNSYRRPVRMDASEINRRVLGWLPAKQGRPFFVFINYFDAHEPYVVPPPYNRMFSEIEPPTRRVREGRRHSARELRGFRDAYDQTLAYLDSQLGVLLGELERRQLLANTVVVITSDHGEEFGEHGWAGHGHGLYLPVLRVPLLISFPGRIPGGRVVAEPVTLADLPATVLDVVGLNGQVDFPGHSLANHWDATTSSRRTPASPLLSEVSKVRNGPVWYAVGKGDLKSIIVGKHHYIRYQDGHEELFDITADSWETVDLARSHSDSATLTVVRAALDSAIGGGRRASGYQPH